jgi:hypothetical protein
MVANPAKPEKKMPRMSRALFEFGGTREIEPEPKVHNLKVIFTSKVPTIAH